MLSSARLREVLRTVPATSVVGPWVRAVDSRFLMASPPGEPPGDRPNPLWGGGSRLHGGRFTPRGSFDTIYLASDLETAAREVGAVTGEDRRLSPTKDPFTVVHVAGHLESALDLCDASIQAALGTDPDELVGPWRLRNSPPTQELGAAIQGSGRFCALLAPSAAGRGRGFVVAVFVDRLERGKQSYLEALDASGVLSRRVP